MLFRVRKLVSGNAWQVLYFVGLAGGSTGLMGYEANLWQLQDTGAHMQREHPNTFRPCPTWYEMNAAHNNNETTISRNQYTDILEQLLKRTGHTVVYRQAEDVEPVESVEDSSTPWSGIPKLTDGEANDLRGKKIFCGLTGDDHAALCAFQFALEIQPGVSDDDMDHFYSMWTRKGVPSIAFQLMTKQGQTIDEVAVEEALLTFSETARITPLREALAEVMETISLHSLDSRTLDHQEMKTVAQALAPRVERLETVLGLRSERKKGIPFNLDQAKNFLRKVLRVYYNGTISAKKTRRVQGQCQYVYKIDMTEAHKLSQNMRAIFHPVSFFTKTRIIAMQEENRAQKDEIRQLKERAASAES